ncbi:MAG: hypothetical protein Q8Q86_02355 [Candidatus Daviesbacteria bacterium]|nr:hypothetical protein [Candidatus Daviesbacteria bacterium]
MVKRFLKYKIHFFLIFLVASGIFLRFHNLPNLYIFGFDEEYQATYAMTLVKDIHPIWIGVSASFLDYYLGPYFTYFTAFWLWISHGDPLLTAYMAALVGVATSVVVFFVGWKFFNLTVGIISSLLYAGLPLFVFYDQKYWNPMFVQLIVLVMFVALLLIKKSPWWWLLFTGAVGAIFETDLAPLPLVIIGVWFFSKGKYFLNKKLVLSCIAVFLLFYWPLLVFDYNHNWSNLTVLGRYNQQVKTSGARFDPMSKASSVLDTMGRFWYLEPGKSNAQELNIFCNVQRTYPSPWLIGLSVVLLIYFLYISFKSRKKELHLLASFILLSLLFYILYTGGSFEYYLHGFATLFVFVPAILISQVKGKSRWLFFILIGGVLIAGLNTVMNSSDKYSLGPKKALIGRVMEIVKDESFTLDKMGTCHIYDGWRYLFKAYGRTPARSFTDQNFAWLYPKEVNDGPVSYNVIVSESGAPPDRGLEGYTKISEGGFTAYVKKLP